MTEKTSHWVIAGLKREVCPKVYKKKYIDNIIDTVCIFFDFQQKQIFERSRRRDLVYARSMLVYVLSENTEMTLSDIARRMQPAIKDHTTAIHCRRKIRDQLSLKLPPGMISKAQRDLNTIQNLIETKKHFKSFIYE